MFRMWDVGFRSEVLGFLDIVLGSCPELDDFSGWPYTTSRP